MKEVYEKKQHETEKHHFWYKARRRYILQLLKNSSRHINILDIGCSSGILLNDLIEIGFDSNNLFGIDISPQAIQNCKKNGVQNSFVMDAQLIELERKFDVIIASDCLEHIEDDGKALKNWHSLLKPDGSLYVFVPAFMVLWSKHDSVNMHFRRYTHNELKKTLTTNGFEIIKSGYWNFFLFLPILIIRLLSKLHVFKKEKTTGDLNKQTLCNNLLFQLIHFENRMLKHISFPFGVSTYCIAKNRYLKSDERDKIKDMTKNVA